MPEINTAQAAHAAANIAFQLLAGPPSRAVTALGSTERKPGNPGDPWLTAAQLFILEIDHVEIGTFTEVSGLTVNIAVEPVEEGGQNQFVHQFPGRMTWPNITLKRGVVADDNLFDWIAHTSGDGFGKAGNKFVSSSGAISLITARGTRLRAWNIDRAFPVRWSGPSFAVNSTEVPSEELEIAHHGFKPRNL